MRSAGLCRRWAEGRAGSTVTVTMKLKEDYTTFSDLYTDVMSVPGILDVNIADVQAPNGSNNQKYMVKGEVSGTFTGKAATNSGNHIQNYDFCWKGIQLSSGKDATQEESDNTSIQHTIKIVVPVDYITAQDKLAGDILVGNNTEHDAPMDVDAGDNLMFTGRLNVVSIKDKIKAMKQNFENQGGNAAGIRTEYINSTFIAKLTFPSELTVPENPKAVLTENDLFVITDVTKSGGTVAVTMKLKKDYTKFTDLYTDVTNVADILDVNVPGIKVADTVQDNEQYTVKGEVSGTFVGKATTGSGNHIQNYNFSWTGVQTPDGRDAIQDPTQDPDSIQFTVKVMGSATPGTPDDDKTPATPDQTKTTPSKTNIITVIQVIIKTAGTVPKTGGNSNPALWLVMMMASCLGIVRLVHKVRKNRK